MRKRDRKELARYTRHIANELGLRDWTIAIGREPCDENLAGNIGCIDGARECRITFAAGFRGYDADMQRETVVHELLHAQHAVCWHMVQTDLAEPLGKIAYYVFCDSYRRAMEYNIDALAKALSPHMPHIDWPAR